MFPSTIRIIFFSLLCYSPLVSFAQLCTGSLGDPVININFGTPSNPQTIPPLSGYTFTTSFCPDDGYYSVSGSTRSCFNNSWHTVSTDHTGNGSFMIVNASYTPGDFFLSRISGLCAGTTYEFAAWMMNLLVYPGIKPNLLFTIETPSGTILQTYATGDIPETAGPLWKQYGFFFTTPANNPEIILRIRNNAPGGIGNDIGLDDITFRPCGPEITTNIEGFGDSVNTCENDTESYLLKATVSSGFSNPAFHWQLSMDTGRVWQDIPSASTLSLSVNPQQPGLYFYRLTVAESGSLGQANCRIASKNVFIDIHRNPQVDAGPDRIIFPGDSIIIQATVIGDPSQYLWTPADYLTDPTILNPRCSATVPITYTLNVTSIFGCQASDMMMVGQAPGIFVPTAFTPNNDGLNDRWRIPGIDPVLGASVFVYNLYGQVVYKSEKSFVNWDGTFSGKPLASGNYVYMVVLQGGKKIMKGIVTLIR